MGRLDLLKVADSKQIEAIPGGLLQHQSRRTYVAMISPHVRDVQDLASVVAHVGLQCWTSVMNIDHLLSVCLCAVCNSEWKDMSPWQKALSVVAGIVFGMLFILICCVVLVVFCAGSVLFCILDCLTLGPCRRACGCYWFPWDKKADENIDDADAPVHHSNSNSLSDIVKMEQQVVQAAPPPPPPMDYQAQNFQNYGAPPPPHNYGAPPPPHNYGAPPPPHNYGAPPPPHNYGAPPP
eukprot:Selendium_serpulae@DN4386_c0_g1_i2.p1